METKKTFSAVVVVLNEEANIEPHTKEFNHDGVIEKGQHYDAEKNTTLFRYCNEHGQHKSYVIEGKIPAKNTASEAKLEKKPAAKKPAAKKAAKKAASKKASKKTSISNE